MMRDCTNVQLAAKYILPPKENVDLYSITPEIKQFKRIRRLPYVLNFEKEKMKWKHRELFVFLHHEEKEESKEFVLN